MNIKMNLSAILLSLSSGCTSIRGKKVTGEVGSVESGTDGNAEYGSVGSSVLDIDDIDTVNIDTGSYDTGSSDTGEVETIEALGCTNFADYAACFGTEGAFNGYFVIGEDASSMDNLAMTDIATNMFYTNDSGEADFLRVVDATKLDSEITDYSAQNLIVIGRALENRVTGEIYSDQGYARALADDQSSAEFITHDTGYTSLMVFGVDPEHTRVLARVIAQRADELTGERILVTGNDYATATIVNYDVE
ncbi:hypothetical protein HOA92_00735 [archaeon]|jgi:hypothetical protein|nr:hypothetical protein [archaeon]MBT6761543.1 hypothetical protein [archaeon]